MIDDNEKEALRLRKELTNACNKIMKYPNRYKDTEPRELVEALEKYKTREALAKALGKYIATLNELEKLSQ